MKPLPAALTLMSVVLLSSCVTTGTVDPLPPPGAYADGEILFLRGNFEEAGSAFRTFIARNPRTPYASDASYWAGVCALKLGDTRKARRYISKTYSRPRTAALKALALTSLADCDYADGEFSAAAGKYRRAADMSGISRDRIYYQLARCYSRMDKRKEADRYLRMISESYPASKYAEKARNDLGFSGSGGAFSIQAGAFGSRKNADALRSRLEGLNRRPYLQIINRGGEILYCVRVGHFKTRARAGAALRKLQAAGFDGVIIP